MNLQIEVGRELFRFNSSTDWVHFGRERYADAAVAHGILLARMVAIDAKGRICVSGLEFDRAQRDGAYPVVVYAIDPKL